MMNIEETKKAKEVMQAFVDGADIEWSTKGYPANWTHDYSPVWNWNGFDFRVRAQKPDTGFLYNSFVHESKPSIELTPEVVAALKAADIEY